MQRGVGAHAAELQQAERDVAQRLRLRAGIAEEARGERALHLCAHRVGRALQARRGASQFRARAQGGRQLPERVIAVVEKQQRRRHAGNVGAQPLQYRLQHRRQRALVAGVVGVKHDAWRGAMQLRGGSAK